jgi:hypothetical protein
LRGWPALLCLVHLGARKSHRYIVVMPKMNQQIE